MSEREIKNAVITSVQLGGYDGHGSMLTAWVYLDFGGSGQGFGGRVLGGLYTHEFIVGVIDALKADSWESLVGKPCRVEHSWDAVHRIGHFLEDRWYDAEPSAEALAYQAAKRAAEGEQP